MSERPAWAPRELYPFETRVEAVAGARVNLVDEGAGPPLLMLHGNPTWSFLYRELVRGLRDRFRCLAVDLPGFGLSAPAPGFGFTPAEHAEVLEALVAQLDLRDVTMMVQDWGGPIGFAVATRHAERFRAFVIANTWRGRRAIRPPSCSRACSAARSGAASSRIAISSSSASCRGACAACSSPTPPWTPTADRS